MKNPKWFQSGRVRRALRALFWCLAVAGSLVLIHVFGIALAGNVARWQAWMRAHANLFFVWRLLLYGGIAAGWVWIRRRLIQREPFRETHWRLARVELACVVVVILLEFAQSTQRAMP